MEKKNDISLKEDTNELDKKSEVKESEYKEDSKMKIDVGAFLNKKKERTEEENKIKESNKKPITNEDTKKNTSTNDNSTPINLFAQKGKTQSIFDSNVPLLFTKTDNGNTNNTPLFGQPITNNSLFSGTTNVTFGSGDSTKPLFGSFITQAGTTNKTNDKKTEEPNPIFSSNTPLFGKKDESKPLQNKADEKKSENTTLHKQGDDKPNVNPSTTNAEIKPPISIPHNEPKAVNPPKVSNVETKQTNTLSPPPKQNNQNLLSKSKSPVQIATPPSSQQNNKATPPKPLIQTNTSTVNQQKTLPELPPAPTKKVISFYEAKKEIDDFTTQLIKMEEDLSKKYSITFPDLSFEDTLPDEIKIKLVEDYFESKEIKDLLTKIK